MSKQSIHMLNKGAGQPEKISPAERARSLAREAAQKREQQYGELKERIVAAEEVLANKRQELGEVQEGLDEIAVIEKGGPLSPELLELRTELKGSEMTLAAEVREASRAVREMEADPLHVEFASAAEAAEVEVARVKAEEKELRQKQEKRDQQRRVIENLDATIREISAAIGVAERREIDIRDLREDKKKLEQAKEKLAKDIEGNVDSLFLALPDSQQVKINLLVYEAQKSGKKISGSSATTQDGRARFRPAGTTMPEWFAAWHEKVTPSFLPFLDKPLRELGAFEDDQRMEEVQKITERLQELSSKESALFTDRKDTNNAFMERLLSPDSGLMTLNRVDWDSLRFSEDVNQPALREKLQNLRNLKEKSQMLTADVDEEYEKQYKAQGGSQLFSPIGANIA